MTIDERIEKLTERHEALAQSLELFSQITSERIQNLTEHMIALADSLKHLSETAIDHERRIQKIEGA